MKNNKSNIKIIVNINGEDHSMTYDEAEKLYQELNEIFGKKESIPYSPLDPYWERTPFWPTNPNTTPCIPRLPDITYCLSSDIDSKIPKFIKVNEGFYP